MTAGSAGPGGTTPQDPPACGPPPTSPSPFTASGRPSRPAQRLRRFPHHSPDAHSAPAQPAASRSPSPPSTTARLSGSPRREFTLLILLGAAGAGLVLLAMRQAWAHIVTVAPKPLPASVIPVSGQALVPAAAALAVAALACLAAVLATRRLLRRIAGIVLAMLGAGIAVAVSLTISATDVMTAASSSSPRGAVGAGVTPGSGAGSTTAGTSGTGGTPLSGFPGHVAFVSVPWRWAALLGALVIVAAGALIAWRANRLPVMSSRYDLTAREAGTRAAVPAGSGRRPASDSASMWESLSRGEDPTSGE